MKIVITGAGSVAFAPALLSSFSVDHRYRGATIGSVVVKDEALNLVQRFAHRVSDEFGLHWQIETSTDRRDLLWQNELIDAQFSCLPRFQ